MNYIRSQQYVYRSQPFIKDSTKINAIEIIKNIGQIRADSSTIMSKDINNYKPLAGITTQSITNAIIAESI